VRARAPLGPKVFSDGLHAPEAQEKAARRRLSELRGGLSSGDEAGVTDRGIEVGRTTGNGERVKADVFAGG